MDRPNALMAIRKLLPELKEQFGVMRIGVFGSVARNEASESSDIDIVVDMPPDLYAMVHLKEQLEASLHTRVDLVRYRKHMNRFLKQRIDSEAIYA